MSEFIIEFFNKSYESQINKNLLFYKFKEDEACKYVETVINIPIAKYLDFIVEECEHPQITSKDVFQFSNLLDGTINICDKLEQQNNPGLKFLEIGKLLLDDGKERKVGAYTKYGENHIKVALSLDLSFELYHTYYLSGIGYIYNRLNEEDKEKLLVRLILRSKLITRLFQASRNGKVNMREFLYMLSDSTYNRRKSNIKTVIEVLDISGEYEFSEFINILEF